MLSNLFTVVKRDADPVNALDMYRILRYSHVTAFITGRLMVSKCFA
jgi:hypothetical protein